MFQTYVHTTHISYVQFLPNQQIISDSNWTLIDKLLTTYYEVLNNNHLETSLILIKLSWKLTTFSAICESNFKLCMFINMLSEKFCAKKKKFRGLNLSESGYIGLLTRCMHNNSIAVCRSRSNLVNFDCSCLKWLIKMMKMAIYDWCFLNAAKLSEYTGENQENTLSSIYSLWMH